MNAIGQAIKGIGSQDLNVIDRLRPFSLRPNQLCS